MKQQKSSHQNYHVTLTIINTGIRPRPISKVRAEPRLDFRHLFWITRESPTGCGLKTLDPTQMRVTGWDVQIAHHELSCVCFARLFIIVVEPDYLDSLFIYRSKSKTWMTVALS
jgi:hypothetical protein